MKNFFVGSAVFGVPHIVLLVILAVTTAVLIVLTKIFARTDKSITYVIKGTAIVMLLLTILSRFIYNDFTPSLLDFLPNTFCSTMGFVLPIFVLFAKKDSKALYYAVFTAMMGGILTVIVFEDIGQAKVANTLISFTYHGLMATLALLCYLTKYCKPTLEKVPALATGLCYMLVFGLFSNQVLGYSNNMFINSEIIGDITWWICGLGVIGIAISVALIYEACTKKWKEQNLYKIGLWTKTLFAKKKT